MDRTVVHTAVVPANQNLADSLAKLKSGTPELLSAMPRYRRSLSPSVWTAQAK